MTNILCPTGHGLDAVLAGHPVVACPYRETDVTMKPTEAFICEVVRMALSSGLGLLRPPYYCEPWYWQIHAG